MTNDLYITSLKNYNLKIGDKVYVLRYPGKPGSEYYYQEGTLAFIKNNKLYASCPQPNERYYKTKLKRYNKYLELDETERYDYKINFENSWSIVSRKYLYMQNEFDILQSDIAKLNSIKQFKDKQVIELNNFINSNYPNWSLENSRKRVCDE